MKTEKFHRDFILECIRKIQVSLGEIDKDSFMKNQDKQSLVILQLMLIGEASKRLSEDTKSKIDLPWRRIAGFRDVAIHDYTDLNLDDIWDTTNKDIPELKAKMLEYENKGRTL